MKKLLVLLVFMIVLVSGCAQQQRSFKSLYDRYCKEPWAEVGSDGSYLSIDSNPYDDDDDDDDSKKYFSDSWNAVQNINKELGFTEAINKKMGKTSSLDGTQTETSNGVVLSWKYHPDKGMEVMYTFETRK